MIDGLAQEIRRVDGSHNLGAGALAEALRPFIDGLLAKAVAAAYEDAAKVVENALRDDYKAKTGLHRQLSEAEVFFAAAIRARAAHREASAPDEETTRTVAAQRFLRTAVAGKPREEIIPVYVGTILDAFATNEAAPVARKPFKMLVDREQLHSMIEQSADDEECEAGTLHPEASAPVAREDGVRDLEWKSYDCGWIVSSPFETNLWTYYVKVDAIGQVFVNTRLDGFTNYFRSVDEAKLAVQADYTARILAALETPPRAAVAQGEVVAYQVIEAIHGEATSYPIGSLVIARDISGGKAVVENPFGMGCMVGVPMNRLRPLYATLALAETQDDGAGA